MATHVIPVDELVEHERHHDCRCAPYAEPVKRADGTVAWRVVHHVLEDRRLVQTAPDPANHARLTPADPAEAAEDVAAPDEAEVR